MTSEAIGKILSDIGALVGSEAGVGTGDAFLYAEAAENVVGASLFKEKDDRVTYIPTSQTLSFLILDLWEAVPADKKWRALLMTVSGEKFDARFQYDEGWDEAEDEYERRPRVLTAKFGDKPIEFPDYDSEPVTDTAH